MKHYSLIFLTALVFLLSGMVFAQEQEYSISFTDEAVEVPADIVAGFVRFSFENGKAEAPVVIDLARLNDDVSPETFTETYFASIEDPLPVLELVTLYGGTEVFPGESVSISYELEAGNYVLIDFAGTPSFFEVLENPNAVEATAESTSDVNGTVVETTAEATQDADNSEIAVSLYDFSILAPSEIPAGENVWHISNLGEQWHEMAIYRITDESLSNEDVAAFLMEAVTAEDAPMPEGLEPATTWLPMDAEQEAWVTWELEEGRYVLVCFLPDVTNLEAMHSHLELGMIQFVTVLGE